MRRESTRGEEKLTEKGDEGWPKVEGRNVLHCRRARTKVLPKASYFWGQREPLTIKLHELMGYDIQKRKRTPFWHLDKKKLFAFFWFCDVGWDEGILGKRQWAEPQVKNDVRPTDHKSFEIGSPPLGQTVTNFPFVVEAVGAVELLRVGRRGETVVQAFFQTLYFVFARLEVVAWSVWMRLHGSMHWIMAHSQFEKGIGDLEHEDMRMAMVVNDENAFNGAAHAIILVVILQTL